MDDLGPVIVFMLIVLFIESLLGHDSRLEIKQKKEKEKK